MTIKLPKPLRVLYTSVMLKRMRLSIHTVVIGFFLLATVVTATVAISLQYVFSRNLAVETTLSLFENTSDSTQAYLKEVDERASSSARVMAKYLRFDSDKTLSDESRLLFIEEMKQNPLFHAMYVGFENGDYFGIVNLDADPQTRFALQAEPSDRWVIIKINSDENKRQRIMQFVDSQLKLRTTRTVNDDFKSKHRPWFVSATQDKVHKTPPYLFQQLQIPGETYSIKIPQNNAVFGIDITLSSISEYLKTIKTPIDSEMYLFNERGELVASNQQPDNQRPLPTAPKMTLTKQQQKVVEKTPYLMVSNEIDWPPINFAVSGEPYGYSIDVLNYISQMTGIEIRYVNGLAWNDMAQLFVDKELDVLQPVYYERTKEWVGELTDEFLRVPYGTLTAKGQKQIRHIDELQGKTVAIPDGWLLANHLQEHFPTIKIIKVANVRAMFDAVSTGKVDAAIDITAGLNYTARQFFIDDVFINSPLEFGEVKLPETLHFFLNSSKPELKLLFNEALSKLGPEYQQALAEKWFPKENNQYSHLGVIPYKKLIKMAQQGGVRNLVTTNLHGTDYYAYVTPFGEHNDRQDFFAIVTPVSNVLSTGVAKVIDAIMITAAVLLCLLPLAWLLAGPFVKPIRQLAIDSKHIAQRRFDAVGNVDSRIEEIHGLALSMGDMSSSIQQHELAQQQLLDAFIKLIAQAIDDKSPHTAGHCERVPELAFMLIRQANQAKSGIFESFTFDTAQQWREFEVAAWLHDCGKITTPEHIIDKGTKLEANYNRIHEIRMRFEVLWRDAEIDYLIQSTENDSDQAALLIAKQQKQQQLQEEFAFIANANIGGEFMSDEDVERIEQLAEMTWQRYFDDRLGLSHIELARYSSEQETLPVTESLLADKQQHLIARDREMVFDPQLGIKMDVPKYLYNMGEVHNLSVKRGTLADEDRFKINEHIISTIKMLENLPFPEELRNVPRYASTHHETMIGTGYPRKLSADDLSIPERIMVVADIFEALTAADRPYKKAKPISQALDILHKMAQRQHVDIEVFELFLKSGVYLDYAKRFLPAEQLDEVDITHYLRAETDQA